jgi:DNA-binding protein YbaB
MSERIPRSLSQDPDLRYEQLREDLLTLRRDMAELAETAYSPDGLVVATVGAQGALKELVLDPRIYRTTDSVALAETIVATIRDAATAATARMYELSNALLPESLRSDMSSDLGIDFDALLGMDPDADGEADLGRATPRRRADGGR